MSQVSEYVLSRSLEPLCPRDDHRMTYEAKSISWKAPSDDMVLHSLPAYHCNCKGCSVRYDPMNGYFTVVNTPDMPFFIEEPGVNLFQCPRHGTWLHRAEKGLGDSHFTWRCGVEGCDFIRADLARS